MDDGTWELHMTQPEFVEQLLEEFGHYCPATSYKTPFEPGKVLGCKEEGKNLADQRKLDACLITAYRPYLWPV